MFKKVKLSKYLAEKVILLNPGRSLSRPVVRISVISISLSVAVMILSVCMVRGFRDEARKAIRANFPDMWIQSSDEQVPEWSAVRISGDSLNAMKNQFPGLEVYKVIGKTSLLRFGERNEGCYLKGIDSEHPVFRNSVIVKGRWFREDNKSGISEMVIAASMGKNLELDTGSIVQSYFLVRMLKKDSITHQYYEEFVPKSRKFRICGWYEDVGGEGLQELCYVPREVLRKVNGWEPDKVTCYEVVNNSVWSNTDLTGELSAWLFHRASVIPLEQRMFNFFLWLDKLDINGWVVVGLMCVVCVVNAMMSLLILIIEQVREIGLLKALGMSNTSVRNVFFFVAWHILSRGLLFGIIFGLLIGFLQWKFHFIRLDPKTYYIDHVAIGWDAGGVMLVLLILITVCMITLLIPARYIASVRPFRILRYE
jgi:lipoprotein-releasing system permease protein